MTIIRYSSNNLDFKYKSLWHINSVWHLWFSFVLIDVKRCYFIINKHGHLLWHYSYRGYYIFSKFQKSVKPQAGRAKFPIEEIRFLQRVMDGSAVTLGLVAELSEEGSPLRRFMDTKWPNGDYSLQLRRIRDLMRKYKS